MLNTVINNILKTRNGLQYLIEMNKFSHFDSVIDTVNNAKAIFETIVEDNKQSPCYRCPAQYNDNDTYCNVCCDQTSEYERLTSLFSEQDAIRIIINREVTFTITHPKPAPFVVVNNDDDDDFTLPF